MRGTPQPAEREDRDRRDRDRREHPQAVAPSRRHLRTNHCGRPGCTPVDNTDPSSAETQETFFACASVSLTVRSEVARGKCLAERIRLSTIARTLREIAEVV
jgi:hypothetical protein